MIEIKLECETCGGFGGDDERNCPACLGKGWIWAPTPEAAATAPVAFAGDVLALDEFLATKFASPLERQAWARIRALVDGRQKGQATASPGEAPDPSEPFHARKTIRSQAAELKLWHEAYGPIPPAPGEAPADLREAVALAVTDYSAGGEDISHTVDRILSLVHPQAPTAGAPTLAAHWSSRPEANGVLPCPECGDPLTPFCANALCKSNGGAGSQAPGALRWTKEKPTREGFYWYRQAANQRGITEVYPCFGRFLMFAGDGSSVDLVEDAEWSGPIPEPAAEGPAGGAL